MSSNTPLRFPKGGGQLLMRCLNAACSPAGFEAKMDEELECAIGQQCRSLPETISGSEPTRGLFQAEIPILGRKDFVIH